MTKIEWTAEYDKNGKLIRKGETWNTVTGCEKVSTGCKNCYAKTMHKRLTAMGSTKYKEPFSTVVCHYDELDRPYTWKKPRKVFVNSMSDIYNGDVPLSFIRKMFKVMSDTSIHTYQLFDEFKSHPWIQALIKEGERLEYGAHLVPHGGYNAFKLREELKGLKGFLNRIGHKFHAPQVI